MKIIKEGSKNIDTVYSFICNTCGCWFEATREDLQKQQKSHGFNLLYPCPCCGEMTKGVNKKYLEAFEVFWEDDK